MTSNSDTTLSNIAYDYGGIHPLASSSSDTTAFNSSTNSTTDSTPSSPPLYSTKDDVTTIFVVGFPDDMQEREFQNMFMFSKGFEAASLKWHCKDQTEEQEFYNPFNNINKKQMIGFARFRSRHEASEAAQEMNGKKIDWEKGFVLKAEMAKKNLHIKRNSIVPSTSTSTTSILPSLLHSTVMLPEPSSTTSPPPMTMLSRRLSYNNIQTDKLPPLSTVSPGAGYESFSPLPSDLLSPDYYKNHDLFMSTSNTASFGDSLVGHRSHSFDDRNDSHPTSRITITNSDTDQSSITQPFNLFSTKAFHSDLEAEPFSYLSKSTPVPHHEFPFTYKGGLFSNAEDFMLMGRKNSLQPSSNIMDRSSSISSTTPVRPNPADQNPPCNTLYVGNLPPTTNEDELRSLFARCQGYKRMCFRQKPQGPMCFVEFDDVVFATQAMSEHQGHVLTNSVKGGIRLSFSKNPLFIKPTVNKDASIAFNFKQMGTALLADL